MVKHKVKNLMMVFFISVLLTSCSSLLSSSTTAPSHRASHKPTPSSDVNSTAFFEGNTMDIWNKLQPLSPAKLAAMKGKSHDAEESAWIQLAIMTKQNNISTQQLANELMAWHENYPAHPGNQLFPNNTILNQLLTAAPPRQIALLLPQKGEHRQSAQNVREGFLNAYYVNQSKGRAQHVKFYDTTAASDISALYQAAIAEGADFVIGPLAKENVQQLKQSKQPNAASLETPTIALNYSDHHDYPNNFYEFGLLPEDEALQIADRARLNGRSKAIVIAPQSTWGRRVASAFASHWEKSGGTIEDRWYFANRATFDDDIARLLNVNPSTDKRLMKEDNNKEILEMQRRQDFDVIFLFSNPEDARSIVPLLRYYYTGDIPIYTTSSAYSGKSNSEQATYLNGVIVCDIPWKEIGTSAQASQSSRLYALGQDAYLLSQSLQRLVNFPYFPIYGKTGALILSSEHQIHRRLPCMAIHNGRL